MYNVIDALTDVIKDQDDEIRGLNKLVAGRATIHNNEYAAAQEIIICKWLIDQNVHVSPIGRADLIKRLNSGKPNSA